MNDQNIRLPEHRQLPPETRNRLRATVQGGLPDLDTDQAGAAGPSRMRRARTPLAAAAGVAALVIGVAATMQVVSGGRMINRWGAPHCR